MFETVFHNQDLLINYRLIMIVAAVIEKEQQHQAVISSLKEFMLLIAHLSTGDAFWDLKSIGSRLELSLFKDRELG